MNKEQPPHRRFSLTRHKHSLWALPAFGLVLIAALWTATWLQLQSTERTLLDQKVRDTEKEAASFERYMHQAIKNVDQTARLVKHEFEQQGSLDLPRLIREGLVDSSGLVVLNIADASGNIIARSQPSSQFNISDREYFRLHAERDTGLLDISKPVVGRGSGLSIILLSRRMNHPDRSFAGIVSLAVTPDYFTAYDQDADLGKQGTLGLLGLDGTFRARYVAGAATSAPDSGGSQLVTRAQTNPIGHYEERNDDGILRIVAYRKLADYPFIVTAAQSTNEALEDFHQHRNNYLSIAAVVTLVILIFFAVVTLLAVRLQRHRRELKVQRRFLKTLVDNVPSGITVRSMLPGTFGQYVLCNESNRLIFGTGPKEALGNTVRDVMAAPYAAQIMEFDRQLLASPMVQDIVQVRDLPGAKPRILHLVRAPIFGAEGRVDYIMTSATDITQERARMDELELASKVVETTADAIVISDADDRVVMVNAAFTKLTGYDAQEIVGRILAESPFRPLDVAESAARMERQLRDGFVTAEVSRFRKDGTPLSLWVTASSVRNADGTLRNNVRVFTDISLLKETQHKLEQLASFDSLTGVPNRRLLHDRLEQATYRAKRNKKEMAVMFIDLDEFKKVNDTLGHDIGDLLLQQVALRLQKCIRLSDSIGRLGGDEFAIILEDTQQPADATIVGERILAAFASPFVLDGHSVTATASIGIAIYPEDGMEPAELLKNADVAMYRAKQAGCKQFKFFSEPLTPCLSSPLVRSV
jgi:diguanylate cyclase (GGDEF)-like protein/PAS domain S-box-containing protein